MQQPAEELDVEVDFIVSLFQVHSPTRVKDIIDVACGPCPHSIRLAKMGYRVAGLDISRPMLEYATVAATQEGITIELHEADMREFQLGSKYDAALCSYESILHLLSNEEYYRHLRAVADHLRPSGLYYVVLDMPSKWLSEVLDPAQPTREYECREIRRDDTIITVRMYSSPVDFVTGTYDWGISCEVSKGPDVIEYVDSRNKLRVLMTQEFMAILDASGVFDLIGFYGQFDLHSPMTSASPKRIALLRKK